jgi:hypothetical protein
MSFRLQSWDEGKEHEALKALGVEAGKRYRVTPEEVG